MLNLTGVVSVWWITVATYIYVLFGISVTRMNYSYHENKKQRHIHFEFKVYTDYMF